MDDVKEKKYLGAHDAELRLNRCVIFYKNRPYYSEWSGEETKLILRDLLNGSHAVVDANDDGIDAQAKELGWGIHRGNVCFLSRLPWRRQRAGLTADSILITYANGNTNSFGSHDHFFNKDFFNCITNRYDMPSKSELKDKLEMNNGVVLNKDYAIVKQKKSLFLFYKLVKLGKFDLSEFSVELMNEHNHSVIWRELKALGVSCGMAN